MKKYILTILIIISLSAGCNDDFLDREPTDILLEDQVWSDEGLILSVLTDLYNRYHDIQQITAWAEYTNFDEAFASNFGNYWRHQFQDYSYDWWGLWDYGYVRELNLFIQKAESTTQIKPEAQERFIAEARFLRAALYFEHVKRVGGVPIILDPLEYDFSGDPTYLQFPRNKEHEVYDFVISELEEIKDILPNDGNIKSRATKGLALAMVSRAALYAGSIAKYGATTPQVSTPGGEVGIPLSMAEGYYQKALSSAQELINDGNYALYRKKDNLSENFASLFLDEDGNSEIIFVKDYKEKGVTHGFTIDAIPRSLREENIAGGNINVSLNLVQSFEYLDNTFSEIKTIDEATGNYIYYDDPIEAFEGRDARLAGTVILPGSTYRGKQVDIWAGYQLADGSIISADQLGGRAVLPGNTVESQVVGYDGPVDQLESSAQSGFYVRKFNDLDVGSGQRGTGSDVWWVRYRYAEVLLNAAEAAFELGNTSVALPYINEVRQRAGFSTDLGAGDLTFDRIVHERKVELAFEGHILFDMKRWRLAHKVWNGEYTELTNNPGIANEPSTRVFALWPYKIYDPGNPNDGKWIFKEVLPSVVNNAHRFRMGNYYSNIGEGIRNANPKIVKNPNQ
ncbi:RagB/SusD family nutrient uptake outer membrane protein [Flexithrix dorotheae]|uniref:RagB/SusD family nutrient uptake outer membrane protein n=1 Tax=Flexithrix dorotheae TaxID=70993 RepID=UPI000361390F|nr:RagB/SusD family nutrient uptake outer membrane protein [Flexithrix dorotheae]